MQNTPTTVEKIQTPLVPYLDPVTSRKAEFFGFLTEQLANSMDADCVWVAELDGGPEPSLRTLAVYADGQTAENFVYPVAGTPAQTTLSKSSVCIYPSRVQELFPGDRVLSRLDASSYAGIPLFDSSNEPIGLISVVSRNARPDTRLAGSILRGIASRAVMELERMKAAEALRASESRLRLIFENTPDAHLLLTLDGKMVEANRTAEALLGYRREDMIGRNVLLPGVMPEEDLRRAAATLALRAAGSPSKHQEFSIIRHDGSQVTVETYSQLASIDGVRMMLLCMRDITARKAAQKERQEQLDRVQELQAAAFQLATHELVARGEPRQVAPLITETVCRVVRAASVGIWLFSADNEIVCLDRFDAESGRHSVDGALRSDALSEHRLGMESTRVVASPAETLAVSAQGTGRSVDAGVRVRGKVAGFLRVGYAGVSSPESFEETRFISAASHLFALSLVNADHSAAEASLRRTEARLSSTRRLAASGNWERELSTDAMLWSDEVLRLYGVTKEQFVPTRQFFLDRVFPADLGKIDAAVNELFRTGNPCELSFRIVRLDGSLRHVRELMELESDAAGRPVRLVGSVQDVTEFRRMEEHFHAEQRVQSLGHLAGGVARAFNNVLMMVNGYSTLIARNPANQAVIKGAMEAICRAAEDGSQLVDQFVAFSQSRPGETAVIDLNAIVRQFDCMLRSLLGADIEVVSLLEPELGKVEAGAAQLNHVLLNLAIRARHSMPKGGCFTMQTAHFGPGVDSQNGEFNPGAGAWIVLIVTDTGAQLCGDIDPGMSTVQAIVQSWDGKIAAETRPEGGSIVKIFLPRIYEEAPRAENPLGDEDVRGTETILVVEDQPEVRTLACSVLESLGYRVLSAPNADAAVRIGAEYQAPVHLLLTDVVMPGMPGDELANRLRAHRPSIKVLFMSGYSMDAAVRRGEATRGSAFIRKPFDPFALGVKIRELLGTPAVTATILVAGGTQGTHGMLRRVLTSAGYKVLETSSASELKACLRGGAVDVLVADLLPDAPLVDEAALLQIKRDFPHLAVIELLPEGEAAGACPGAIAVLERPIQPDALISAVRKSLLHKFQLETEEKR